MNIDNVVEKYTRSVPVKLTALATELGIPVYLSTMPPRISGLIEPDVSSSSGFRIRINRHEPPERQRFTLAHEIAHYILHRSLIGGGVVDDTMYRSALSSRREVEANKLAAELCMPMAIIEEEKGRRRHLADEQLVDDMARLFKVSKQAMGIRLGV